LPGAAQREGLRLPSSGRLMALASRLTKRSQFLETRRKGRSRANPLVVLQTVPNGLEQSRVGFTVGKWLGNAVHRNRIKRRLKEIVRISRVEAGWDLVIIARRDASAASFEELREAVVQVLDRARLLEPAERVGEAP